MKRLKEPGEENRRLKKMFAEERIKSTAGRVSGFFLHAGVAARADKRKKLERLCRYISQPAVSE